MAVYRRTTHNCWTLLGFSSLIVAVLVACGGPPASDSEPSEAESSLSAPDVTLEGEIDLGALLPMTGDLQAFGETSLNGIQLALTQINDAGGVMGSSLTVKVGDTQTAAQPSIDAAQKLVSIEGVVGIVGALSSGNTIPVAASVTSTNGIALISPASTSPLISELDDGDFLFRTVPSDAFQGVALAQITREKGLDNLAIIYINNDYGEGLKDSFAKAFQDLGGTVAGTAPYEQGNASYRGELAQLASHDADGLVLFGYPENGVTILKQSLEEGFFDTFVFSDGMQAPEIIDAIGEEFLDGVFGTAPQALTDSPAYQTFVTAYEESYGELPPKPFIDSAYDATMLLALAIEKADSTEGEAIRDALRDVANPPGTEILPGEWEQALEAIAAGEDIDYVGASGNVNFNEAGDVAGTFAHWEIEGGEIVTVKVFEPDI